MSDHGRRWVLEWTLYIHVDAYESRETCSGMEGCHAAAEVVRHKLSVNPFYPGVLGHNKLPYFAL